MQVKIKPTSNIFAYLIKLKVEVNLLLFVFNLTNKTVIINKSNKPKAAYIEVCWKNTMNISDGDKINGLVSVKLKKLTNIYISFNRKIAICG